MSNIVQSALLIGILLIILTYVNAHQGLNLIKFVKFVIQGVQPALLQHLIAHLV